MVDMDVAVSDTDARPTTDLPSTMDVSHTRTNDQIIVDSCSLDDMIVAYYSTHSTTHLSSFFPTADPGRYGYGYYDDYYW
jgi:hypothetical protein